MHDWNSCVSQGTVGSNPTLSANYPFIPRPRPGDVFDDQGLLQRRRRELRQVREEATVAAMPCALALVVTLLPGEHLGTVERLMSYLVLARKWRPGTFSEVIGQEHVTQTLTNAIAMDRVAHSFLFTGARGVGKTTTARILARALNCAEGPTATPCGTCSSCTEIAEGTAMDVFEIDGASNRGISEIRELREGIRYAPSRDKYKIYIIDEVHMLTQEAFNALLKTLEEPPAHVLFIFATTEPQKIPVTILSRCQRFDFKRVPARTVIAHLEGILAKETASIEPDALYAIAREGEGSVRDSLSLLDRILATGGDTITAAQVSEILGVADRKWLHGLLESVFTQDTARAMKIVHDVNHFGCDPRHFTRELAHFLRDLLVIRIGDASAREATDLSETEFAAMMTLSTQRSPEDLQRLFRTALKGLEEIAASRFPQLILEMLVVRMTTLRPLVSADSLVARLDAITAQLEAGGAQLREAPAPAGSAAPVAPAPVIEETPAAPAPVVEEAPAPVIEVAPAQPTAAIPVEEPAPIVITPGLTPEAPAPLMEEPAPLVESPGPATLSLAPEQANEPALTETTRITPMDIASEPSEASPMIRATGATVDFVEPAAHTRPVELSELQGIADSTSAPAPESAPVEDAIPLVEVEPEDNAALAADPLPEAIPTTQPLNEEPIRSFRAWLLTQDAPLGGEVAQGRLEPQGDTLLVQFRPELFGGEFRSGSDRHHRLTAAVQVFFGVDTRVAIGEELGQGQESAFESDQREHGEHLQQRRDAAEKHPAVTQLTGAFGGQVQQISLLDEEE